MMTDLNQKRIQAEKVFRSMTSMPDHVSDFGSFCVEQWLTGRNEKTLYRFMAVDYLRLLPNKEIPTINIEELEKKIINYGDGAYLKLESYGLSEKQRCILVLYYEWGFTLKEMGHAFGITEGRASQILKEAVQIVSECFKKDEIANV